MHLRHYAFLLIAFLFSPWPIFARTPPIPFEGHAYPFECCVYRTWIVNKATAVRSKIGSSFAAFNVKRGEKVSAVTGIVITTQYGTMKTLRATTVDGVRVKSR